MLSVKTLPTFDVWNLIERLQPSKERNKYICFGGGNDLSIITPAPDKAVADKGLSNEYDERGITEAITLLIAISHSSLVLGFYQGV